MWSSEWNADDSIIIIIHIQFKNISRHQQLYAWTYIFLFIRKIIIIIIQFVWVIVTLFFFFSRCKHDKMIEGKYYVCVLREYGWFAGIFVVLSLRSDCLVICTHRLIVFGEACFEFSHRLFFSSSLIEYLNVTIWTFLIHRVARAEFQCTAHLNTKLTLCVCVCCKVEEKKREKD